MSSPSPTALLADEQPASQLKLKDSTELIQVKQLETVRPEPVIKRIVAFTQLP